MVLAYNSDFFGLLVSSYRRTVGAEPAFFEPGQQPSAPWLDERARHCVLAHNTDPDPRFIYANKAAQACFEYDWDEITSLPCRLSAEPVDREERSHAPLGRGAIAAIMPETPRVIGTGIAGPALQATLFGPELASSPMWRQWPSSSAG